MADRKTVPFLCNDFTRSCYSDVQSDMFCACYTQVARILCKYTNSTANMVSMTSWMGTGQLWVRC